MKYYLSILTVLLFTIEVTAQGNESDWSETPKTATLDVVTWNVEYFGREDRGPSDVEKQEKFVKEVIDSLNADLIGFQEIYDINRFVQMVHDLEDYSGYITDYVESTLQVAFLFNINTIELLDQKLIDENYGINKTDVNRRYPLEISFRVISDSAKSDTMYAVVYHAMHGTNLEAYNLRLNASESIKEYFDAYRQNKPLVFLGDYNDDVIKDSRRDYPSPYTPYHNFVEDEFYHVVTKPLSEDGNRSHSRGNIDHITINNQLHSNWLKSSEQIHIPIYIDDYKNTTSDHFPVEARFDVSDRLIVSNQKRPDTPKSPILFPNYPNPFNPETTITFQLSKNNEVQLEIFDVMGRKIATLVNKLKSAGTHKVGFNAKNLSTGVYYYRLQTPEFSETKKMLLIK